MPERKRRIVFIVLLVFAALVLFKRQCRENVSDLAREFQRDRQAVRERAVVIVELRETPDVLQDGLDVRRLVGVADFDVERIRRIPAGW